jgi:hypothetical protein
MSQRHPDGDLEPVEAWVVGVGVVSAPDEEHHDHAHGEEACDPAERERWSGRSGSGCPEDDAFVSMKAGLVSSGC